MKVPSRYRLTTVFGGLQTNFGSAGSSQESEVGILSRDGTDPVTPSYKSKDVCKVLGKGLDSRHFKVLYTVFPSS